MAALISRRLLDRIVAEVAANPGREVCGLLLGSGERIEDARAAANIATNPANSFEVDPQRLFEVLRSGRLIGHYHSHPGGVAEPSRRDAEAAGDCDRLWLIVAGEKAALWRETEGGAHLGRFERVELIVG